jgi:hypothetical protein
MEEIEGLYRILLGKLDAEQKERAQKEKWISELEEELK